METRTKPSPILLLPGETHHVAKDGKSRTRYSIINYDDAKNSSYYIEEEYDLQNAKKKFIVQSNHDSQRRPIGSIDIHEIQDGIESGIGTGSLTWESALVSSLFFASRSHLLYGNCLELGGGLGLGILLTNMLVCRVGLHHSIKSFTISDYNNNVLNQSMENIANNYEQVDAGVVMDVKYVNWYDYDTENFNAKENNKCYDTIIGSDIVYRIKDIQPLLNTIKSLLKEDGAAHIYGPNNRAAIQTFHQEARRDPSLTVLSKIIHVERCRLQEDSCDNPQQSLSQIYRTSSSQTVPFLHLTIFRKLPTEMDTTCMESID
ncbi:hypothetical protein CTEN210_04444 [Chaetoceros tenuissimus]|uniref:Calmodulin-lysine N-methyltransferase n=1 Tax=Chaetoceros tenuissimus TaxID=426638 RepID=A0AAD3CLW1_9STRA|nr:hypothetical protein CTEN210_04444 [Chaetoceros tenuissimus]